MMMMMMMMMLMMMVVVIVSSFDLFSCCHSICTHFHFHVGLFLSDPPQQRVLNTQLIQIYLDENHCLLQAALENHNRGNVEDAHKYLVHLQKNLIYLATLADLPQSRPKNPPS